ncbi:hypothetical protein METY_1341 [Methylopila sp. Yamaguchi]|nr:hypothetical protein METY_1341 [Methylopila sp. Yamaguchi]
MSDKEDAREDDAQIAAVRAKRALKALDLAVAGGAVSGPAVFYPPAPEYGALETDPAAERHRGDAAKGLT